MSTQQDIYVAGSENRPPMLNKDNYVPWSSRLLRYAKSKPNGKLIYTSIMNGPYVKRMIPEPGDPNRDVRVAETFHEQTDEELTEKEVKQMEADDQAIQTILMGLPEDIYAAIDSCETDQEIWLRVQQMMKGSDIGIQEKKAKLFNEWERNKHFSEKIANNLKFLNNLKPEWSRHVTIVHQTKDFHKVDYTQLYDFLKYNHEVNELRVERLARAHDPLALMTNSNNPYNYLVFHQDQPSQVTYMQQPQPNNNYILQPSFNTNYMQQPMPNPEDITDPTTATNMALVVQNAVQTSGIQNVGNQNGLIVVPGIAHQNVNQNGNGNLVAARAKGNGNGNNRNQIRCYNCRGLGHLARNCTVRPRKRDVAYLQTQLLIAQKEEAGIQLQAEEFNFMAAAGDLDEIEETDKAPIYDSDGSAEVIQICLWCVDSGTPVLSENLKLLINFIWKFLGTVSFRNDHIAAILGYGDLQWGNILITRVYFVDGLVHNLFLVGQFCDSDLEVAFRRNTCFVRNLEGVDLLKGNHTTNLYTINLHEMASASPICLMARATSTGS
ncbi:retrovirus-related pol polyprotein from transposon TNT 1-94 [Tanacetum coccineum]